MPGFGALPPDTLFPCPALAPACAGAKGLRSLPAKRVVKWAGTERRLLLAPAPAPAVFFEPRPLTNLELIDRLESMAPITDMKVRSYRNEWFFFVFLFRFNCQVANLLQCTIRMIK